MRCAASTWTSWPVRFWPSPARRARGSPRSCTSWPESSCPMPEKSLPRSDASQDIAALDEAARSRLRLKEFGFIFQFGQLLPDLSALDNVTIPLLLAGTSRRRALAQAPRRPWRLGLGEQPGQAAHPARRAARRSGPPSHGTGDPTRVSSSPTSPPAPWTPWPPSGPWRYCWPRYVPAAPAWSSSPTTRASPPTPTGRSPCATVASVPGPHTPWSDQRSRHAATGAGHGAVSP